MRHIIYEEADSHPIAILIKNAAFNTQEIRNIYVAPMLKAGVPLDKFVGVSLAYNPSGKAPVGFVKDYLETLMPALASVGVKHIYCADANYFKVLTKQQKAEANLGYVLPCALDGYEDMKVILGVNHKSLIYDPSNEPKLDRSLLTLEQELAGSYKAPGQNIIHQALYPMALDEIAESLNKLLDYDQLTCDLETFSLRFNLAGIATIGFGVDQHNGLAFPVDYVPFTNETPEQKLALLGHSLPRNPEETDEAYDKRLNSSVQNYHGYQRHNPAVKNLLRKFFEEYRGTLIFQGCTFDTKVLIYELWMKDLLDTHGLLKGLDILYRQIQDTKVIAYLATNTCAGNKLGLKELAHEFAGNYAQEEIKDVRKIPLPQLLEYNLVDDLCTWFAFDKYYPIMVADQQEALYHDLMMPSQKVITQTELTGMSLNPKAVWTARLKLEQIMTQQQQVMAGDTNIQAAEQILTQRAWEKDYEDRKKKAKNPDKILPKNRDTFPRKVFNPNSGPQIQVLAYEVMGLPVIDLTDTKQPATGGETLEKLTHHTSDPAVVAVLDALQAHAEAAKILSTFISAFERAIDKGQEVVWLHGNFNLGGTKSGRLSSSEPNLQNMPAGSTYGKLVKECFQAPDGELFCGADFNSLEDYISALTTKDPNKLKVYLEGYDGHCLRAFSYWPEKLPGIVETPDSINSIKKLYKAIRDLSKSPTFALTYQGTWHTLVNNLGFSEADAKRIEANYHELYKVSDAWVQEKLDQASIDGYVTCAFGLRLRTPLLSQVIRGRRSTPYEAEAEGRTAGNALGQSYGLLTNRACNEFMQKVWQSRFRYDIRPVAMIHDAIYLLIKDDIEVVEWVNRELIKSMQWQELPEIQHDTVKIGAELDIFWPTWATPLTIPNYADQEGIRTLCVDFQTKLAEAHKEAA